MTTSILVQRTKVAKYAILLISLLLASPVFAKSSPSEIWRGLVVEREDRCSPYDRKRDYRYPPQIEEQIISDVGAIYGPYTKIYFTSAKQTDIEHIVATSEAHDSGLCLAGREKRLAFAQDLRNLTLASARVNRHIKRGHDAGQWVPDHNKCWFAGRVMKVKSTYNLTVDLKEVLALEQILSSCTSTAMEY